MQPRLAGDSCLQLSVITFYLLRRYLWMWDKSLHSDPLHFYYLQDGIRVGLLGTGYTASVGPRRCLRADTGGHRSTSRFLLHPPGPEPPPGDCSASHTAALWKGATGLWRSTRKLPHLQHTQHGSAVAATPGPKALTEVTAEHH